MRDLVDCQFFHGCRQGVFVSIKFIKPRPIIALATLLFVALTCSLGVWQFGRGETKRRLAAAYAHADSGATVHWAGELGDSAWHHRFVVSGRWVPEATIFLDNRVLDGRSGMHAVLALLLDDGRILPVNAGWVAKSFDQTPKLVLPLGYVTMAVRLMPPQQRYVQLAPDAVAAGPVWQNLDVQRYQSWVNKPLVPALGLALDHPYGLITRWPAPDFGIEKHYAYAGQWFLFALLALFFFIKLHWKRSTK